MEYFVGHFFDESKLPVMLRKKGLLFVSGTEKMRFKPNFREEPVHGKLYVIPFISDDKSEIKEVWGEIVPFEQATSIGIDPRV